MTRKRLWAGGSSKVLSSALAAPIVMRSASSIRQIFRLPDERAIHDLVLDFSDLLNLDLLGGLFWVRLDDEKVRMRAGVDLLAGSALATTVETFRLWGPFAVERLCETNGRQSFPDRFLAVEQIGVSQTLMGDGGL